MTGCIDCGCPTPRRRCKQCELMKHAEERARANAEKDEGGEDDA